MLRITSAAGSTFARNLIVACAAVLIAAFAAAAPAEAAEPGGPNCYGPFITAERDAVTPVYLGCVESDATVSLLTEPEHGTVSAVHAAGAGTWTVDYTPDAGFTGSDAFTYKGSRNGVDSDPQTVTVTVVDPAPPVCETD